MIKNLLLDLDGTLIGTNHCFNKPIAKCAEIISEALKEFSPDIETLITLSKKIRKELQIWDGRNIDPFVHSWIETYEYLCDKNYLTVDEAVKHALIIESQKYVQESYTIFPNVGILSLLSFNKAICTLGYYPVQHFKLTSSNLKKFVPEDKWFIVPMKNFIAYRQVLKHLKWNANETIMVGDNLRLDILPALECGMQAIYVNSDHISAHTLEKNDNELLKKYREKGLWSTIYKFSELSSLLNGDNIKYK